MSTNVNEEPWRSAMIEAGLTTSANDIPSLRRLADRANIHPATLSRIIRGVSVHPPSDEYINRMGDALNRPPLTILEWLGLIPTAAGEGDYVPPVGSASLTVGQREAVDGLISAFIQSNLNRVRRRSAGSRLVDGLAKELGMSTTAVADMLERIDTRAD